MTRRKRQVEVALVAVLGEAVEASTAVMAGNGAHRADTADGAGAAAVDTAEALLACCHGSRRRGWEGSEQEGLGCMVWHLG